MLVLHTTMSALNGAASRAALAHGVICATDVTGFGLLGHALNVARGSGVSLRIDGKKLPELPGARALWRSGTRTGGAERNEAYLSAHVDAAGADPADLALALDPQTSGGLLVSLDPSVADAALQELKAVAPAATVIGRVTPSQNHLVVIR